MNSLIPCGCPLILLLSTKPTILWSFTHYELGNTTILIYFQLCSVRIKSNVDLLNIPQNGYSKQPKLSYPPQRFTKKSLING